MMLRVSEADKAAIAEAAGMVGKSATRFVVDAALKEARGVAKRPRVRGVHGGVPTYFKAICFEASQGGAGGYANAGYHLAAGVGGQQPYDVEDEEWAGEVGELNKLIADAEEEAVWHWFRDHYPKFMAFVPSRRRDQFLAGVRRAYDEGIIEL